jgi:isoprenylcysteine carboxyl methyltransferase (ICMT) family protein YpbQ
VAWPVNQLCAYGTFARDVLARLNVAHPNYVAVAVEGIALPLIHACWITAAGFTILNAALLRVRLRVENDALATLQRARLADA